MSAEAGTLPQEQVRYVYAGFWVRVGAMLVDVFVVGRLLLNALGGLFRVAVPDPRALGPFRVSHLLVAVAFWAYLVVATGTFGRTLGKHVFGLRVVNTGFDRSDWATVLFREVVGRIIVTATLFLGYAWVASDRRKQGWHDRIADTYVVRRVTLLTVSDPWAGEGDEAGGASGDPRTDR